MRYSWLFSAVCAGTLLVGALGPSNQAAAAAPGPPPPGPPPPSTCTCGLEFAACVEREVKPGGVQQLLAKCREAFSNCRKSCTKDGCVQSCVDAVKHGKQACLKAIDPTTCPPNLPECQRMFAADLTQCVGGVSGTGSDCLKVCVPPKPSK